jgi:DNA-binding transcriptional LysR family regulator
MYYERCCQHLDDIAATEVAVSGDSAIVSGSLRVSVPHSFGSSFLAPHFSRFIERYPALKTEIFFSDRIVDLAQDGIDLAVRITRNIPGMYVARRLAVIRVALCASPAYLARAGTPRTPDDLVRHNCIAYSNLASGNFWTLRKSGREHVVPVQGTCRSNNGDMNRVVALAGQGIICEPTFIVGDDLRAGRLVRLLPDYETIPNTAQAVFLPSGRNSARIRALLDFLVTVFEEEFSGWDRGLQ